jgi:stage V sporulation protein G
LKITSVNVRKIERENSRIRGIASVVLDECFVVHGIRIIEGDERLFIVMPNRKTNNDEYHDVAHPITQECRKMFEDAVIEEYNNTKDE